MNSEKVMDMFQDKLSYGGNPLPQKNIESIISLVDRLEEVVDVRSLIPLMIR